MSEISPIIPSEAKIASGIYKQLTSLARSRKTQHILSKLEKSGITLDDAKKADPYYIACIARTIDAIEKASCEEKVQALKALYVASETANIIQLRPDSYQEVLSIFAEMSYREIRIIYLLDEGGLLYKDDPRVEITTGNSNEPTVNDIFHLARKHCANEIGLSLEILDALLMRLLRTGLLTTTATWESSIYFFSPLYRDLKKFFGHEYYGT